MKIQTVRLRLCLVPSASIVLLQRGSRGGAEREQRGSREGAEREQRGSREGPEGEQRGRGDGGGPAEGTGGVGRPKGKHAVMKKGT